MRNKKILMFSLSFLICALVLTIPISNSQPSWNGPVRLTNHNGEDAINIQGGCLALDSENKIHVVTYYAGQIFYIYDNQGFINESMITNVFSLHTEYRASPVIAVDSTGMKHIVYYSGTEEGYDLYYVHSLSGGGFSEPLRLTANNITDSFPQMVIDKNDVIHIVYQNAILEKINETVSKIIITMQYINSTDYENFSPPEEIVKPTDADVALNYKIALDSNNKLHIVYQASEVYLGGNYYVVYTNNTAGSFSSYDIINVTAQDFDPAIAIGPNDAAHIIFRGGAAGGATQDLYYVNNTSGSFNGTTPTIISTVDNVQGPTIMISDNYTVNVVFYAYNETWGDDVIKLLYTSNSTGSFSQESYITLQEYDQFDPYTLIDSNGNIHVVYVYGQIGNEDIYYITTSGYVPVGVGPPEDPTLLFIIIGVVSAVAAISVFTILYKKFRSAEKQLWEPKLGDDEEDKEI